MFDATAREWARRALNLLGNRPFLYVGDVPTLASGTYEPTLTNTTNLDASTAFVTSYMQVGSTVTLGGLVQMDPTASGTVVLGVTIPVASNFGSVWDAGGTFQSSNGTITGAISANATDDRLTFTGNSTVTVNTNCYFSVVYTII